MNYKQDYRCVGDLEVAGKLQLDDREVAECLCSHGDAVYTPGKGPSAEEFRECVELINELKEKLNALVGALT